MPSGRPKSLPNSLPNWSSGEMASSRCSSSTSVGVGVSMGAVKSVSSGGSSTTSLGGWGSTGSSLIFDPLGRGGGGGGGGSYKSTVMMSRSGSSGGVKIGTKMIRAIATEWTMNDARVPIRSQRLRFLGSDVTRLPMKSLSSSIDPSLRPGASSGAVSGPNPIIIDILAPENLPTMDERRVPGPGFPRARKFSSKPVAAAQFRPWPAASESAKALHWRPWPRAAPCARTRKPLAGRRRTWWSTCPRWCRPRERS